MAPKHLSVDVDLRAKEFATMTVAAMLAFADATGHDLRITFVKSEPTLGAIERRTR